MEATREFVLDGSITMAWGFEDEEDDYAPTILDRMPELQAHVPSLWPLEVANVLLVGERRGRMTPDDAARFLTILGGFPISVDEETVARAWSETLQLARTHNLSAYDASYLELAIRRGLPLASLDAKLIAAAHVVGVAQFAIP